jgi:5'-methylthioadenosine phosphorylase
MTNMPEAKLAREAELCYATIALSTDYDCWKEEGHVDVGSIIGVLKQNVANAQKVLKDAVAKLPPERKCACANALAGAIMTDSKLVPKETKKRLEPIAGRYLK